MTAPATPVLRRGWYTEIRRPGVDPACPGLYEWHIGGVGSYIGQYTWASRPRLEYARNVARLLCGHPYRKNRPHAFRRIHRELASAVREGRQITLTLLENQPVKTERNRRERELVAERRAEAGELGLRCLNSN